MIPKRKPISREKRNEYRMRYYYKHQAPRSEMAYCSICGGILRRKGFSEAIGFHQKCDRAEYLRLWRLSKTLGLPNTTPRKRTVKTKPLVA